MTKNQQLIEKIIVTAFEAAIAYISINQTNLSGNAKWTAIGALGAALSAVYNLLRQSNPTIAQTSNVQLPVSSGDTLNGVTQLTAPGMPVPPVEPPAPTV